MVVLCRSRGKNKNIGRSLQTCLALDNISLL